MQNNFSCLTKLSCISILKFISFPKVINEKKPHNKVLEILQKYFLLTRVLHTTPVLANPARLDLQESRTLR